MVIATHAYDIYGPRGVKKTSSCDMRGSVFVQNIVIIQYDTLHGWVRVWIILASVRFAVLTPQCAPRFTNVISRYL